MEGNSHGPNEILLWHLSRGFDEEYKYRGPQLGYSMCHQDSTNHLLNTSWKLYTSAFTVGCILIRI